MGFPYSGLLAIIDLEQSLLAAVGAMAAAIGFMFRHMLTAEKECREDR